MSYANFGPDFRVQSVDNLFGANIIVPVTANNAAIVETPLIQTLGGVEIPLVLGEGVWAITARCLINPFDGAETYQYIQSVLYSGANIVASSAPVLGASVAGAANVEFYFSLTYFMTIPAGVNRILTYRLRSNGNPARTIPVVAGYSQIVAHKLSA